MTDTSMQHDSRPIGGWQFLAALAPRLPRMVAASAVVMFLAFAALQFVPQTFRASLTLSLPAGSTAPAEAAKLLDQQHLGEVVSRLPPEIIAELRGDGGGMLDTTALLRQRLTLTPSADGANLDLAATAATPVRARAIVAAMTEGYAALAEPPAALPEAAPEEAAAAAPLPPTLPGGENGIELLQEKLSLAWEERIRLDSRVQRIEALIADGNYAMLALDAENLPGLGRKLDELATLEAERTRLAVDFLPNHPRMRTIKEEIDQLSSDLSAGMQQLAGLVVADRDAARRLEDSLRAELATAAMPVAADTSVVTGSISGQAEPSVVALPRPIRTELVLALSGGLSFFGQIGLFALLRARRQRPMELDVPDLVEEPMPEDAAVALDPPAIPAMGIEHNWLDAAALPDIEVEARWTVDVPSPLSPPEPEALRPEPTPSRPIDAARVIAVSCRGEAGAGRRLLAHYQRLGRRVVLVDAASRRRGMAAGISDLSQNRASFADIIHGSGSHEAALIPWGRQAQFDPGAKPVRILVQALSELYDVVVLALDGENPAASAPLAVLADMTIPADAVPVGTKTAA